MSLSAELKRRVPTVIGPLFGFLFVAYFAYHALEGDRGLRAWQRLDLEIAQATAVRDGVAEQRRGLEDQVARLHPDHLDTDLLEERARLVLGYVPADVLVLGDGTVPHQRLAINVSVH